LELNFYDGNLWQKLRTSSFFLYFFTYFEKKTNFFFIFILFIELGFTKLLEFFIFQLLLLFNKLSINTISFTYFLYLTTITIRKAFQNTNILKYLRMIINYTFIHRINTIFQFLLTGFYFNSIENGFLNWNFFYLIILDIFFLFIQKYNLTEKLIIKIFNFCKFEMKENSYSINDKINESSIIEAQLASYVIISFSALINFLYYYDIDFKIADCKGYPNPAYFSPNINTVILFIIMIIKLGIVILFTNIIFPKMFKTEKLYIPSFNTFYNKLVKIIIIYFFCLTYGYRMMIYGIYK